MATTTPTQLANVPLPAGATEVDDWARSAVAGRDFPFVRPTNGLTTGHNKRGCADSVSGIGEV